MSKYEEALDELFMWATNGYCALEYGDENYVRLKAVMQELVDKVTPTKPLIEADGFYDGELVYDTWVCQKCGERYEIDYDKYDYCPKCGQAIDWSKNE